MSKILKGLWQFNNPAGVKAADIDERPVEVRAGRVAVMVSLVLDSLHGADSSG